MTPEDQKRVEQIRERARTFISGTIHAEVYHDDVNLLLSLVKSQEACELCDRPVGDSPVCLDCYNVQAGAWEESQKQLASATDAMRSACVAKVKSIRDDWASDEISRDCGTPVNALNEAIIALESVSIQQEQEKIK